MILANEISTYSKLTNVELSHVLDLSGYPQVHLETSEFLGITEDGHFCYKVKYFDDPEADPADLDGRVYVYKDKSGQMRADF